MDKNRFIDENLPYLWGRGEFRIEKVSTPGASLKRGPFSATNKNPSLATSGPGNTDGKNNILFPFIVHPSNNATEMFLEDIFIPSGRDVMKQIGAKLLPIAGDDRYRHG